MRPVGFFDSGLGGASVLREALHLLPNENYLYYGDDANAPYGDRSYTDIAFLTENADELLSGGGWEFEGVENRKVTRVTRFYCCISVIFLTYMEQSGFVLTDGSAGTKALCILLALTGGWWGFPWGPIRTVQSVYKTCTADSMTVYDILEKLSLA